MKIQKKYQGAIPLNRICNEHDANPLNTYNTIYINDLNTNNINEINQLNAKIDGIVIPTVPKVINTLTSSSTTDALSAAQGKALNDFIGTKLIYKPVVLWTNSSPKSEFKAQTINVSNLSQYNYIEVIYYNWTQGQYAYESAKAPVENGGIINLSHTINLYGNDDLTTTCHFGSRLGTMNTTNNTITWTGAHGCILYTNKQYPAQADNQYWGVPVKILGYNL